MATWTTIPDSSLEPGKPIRSIDALALRDNPVAIAEGASGAPKVRTAALQPPVAGGAYIIKRLKQVEGELDIPSTDVPFGAIVQPGSTDLLSDMVAEKIQCLVSGSIRIVWEMRGSPTTTARMRFAKNGTLIQTTTGPNDTTFRSYSFDVSVSAGDVITMYDWAIAYRNAYVKSSTPDIAVV